MGTIKDRNRMDLKEAKIIRGGKNTEELYKKVLHDPDNHDGVITQLSRPYFESGHLGVHST